MSLSRGTPETLPTSAPQMIPAHHCPPSQTIGVAAQASPHDPTPKLSPPRSQAFLVFPATKSPGLDRPFLKRRGPSMPWHEHPPRYDRRRKARSALARRQQCTVLLSR